MNILGIDFGMKRIGLATMQTDIRIAFPIGYIQNNTQSIDSIVHIITDKRIDSIVIGIPKRSNNSESAIHTPIQQFVAALQKQIDIPVNYTDEARSSKSAESFVSFHTKKHTKHADDVSACHILENYIRNQL